MSSIGGLFPILNMSVETKREISLLFSCVVFYSVGRLYQYVKKRNIVTANRRGRQNNANIQPVISLVAEKDRMAFVILMAANEIFKLRKSSLVTYLQHLLSLTCPSGF